MTKIICIIPTLQSGGMERVMSLLANYFVEKKNVELHLVLYGKSRKIFYPLSKDINIHKPSFRFRSYPRFISTLKTFLYVRRTVRKVNPETILSFGEYWNSFVLLALKGVDVPIYISDRCQPNKSLGRLHDSLRRWLYPSAAGVIAQTLRAKKVYQQQELNSNISVIHNPIHQISSNGERKENIILTVGRLIESKHHDRLIRIFKDASLPGWKLVIVGGNALKQNRLASLKNSIKELGMENSVELTGTVPNVEPYYNKSKIFALTSSSEGFPNVIGEAMSAGLPVIAYDCVAGPSDMIDHEQNGFLVPLFNDREFSENLSRLMKDETLRHAMGRASKEKITKFSVENAGEQYYSFIRDMR